MTGKGIGRGDILVTRACDEALEPEKGANHAVRQKLGEAPENVIKKEIDKCMEKYV